MIPPITIIVNPAAGAGKAIRRLPAVEAVLAAAGARYQVRGSSSLHQARALAAEAAAQGDLVVAAGGDGTVGAIAGVLASVVPDGTGVFGVIPAGHGNDCARTYGIPSGPADAARLLLAGQPRLMDLIAITGADGNHATAAGSVYLGIASVAGEIASTTRLIRGPLIYPAATLRALATWKSAAFTVSATGPASAGDLQRFRGYAVVVANLPYFGAGMKVAPTADPGDGLLDIVLVHDASKLAFLRMLAKSRDGSHVELSQVSTRRATTVEISMDPPLRAGADGEPLQMASSLQIRVVPGALSIIAPHPAETANAT